MKKLLVLLFALALNLYSQEVPEQLTIGKLQILEKLAEASKITVECSAPGMKTFYAEADIPSEFNSIEDISQVVESIRIQIEPTDPTVEFSVCAQIKDAVGEVQFEARNGFRLEKVYGKNGISYRVPYYAGDLYFWFANREIYFPDAQAAYFISGDQEFKLEVIDGNISVSLFGDGVLKVVTSQGIYYYDWNTGTKISGTARFSEKASFEDIARVGFGYYVNRTLYPEFGYCPWLEVIVPDNGIVVFNIQSYQGSRPIGALIQTMDGIRRGLPETKKKYEGSELTVAATPGTILYFWFDFSPWVWNYSEDGGKG